jgi:hypothetical protein
MPHYFDDVYIIGRREILCVDPDLLALGVQGNQPLLHLHSRGEAEVFQPSGGPEVMSVRTYQVREPLRRNFSK